MDSKELRGLMEAYSEVYSPQEEIEQLNELSNRKLRAYIKKSDKSHAEINKKWDQGTATDREKHKSIGHEIGQERAFRTLDKRTRKEDLDIFDVVLEFLQTEGFAETLEDAEFIMANDLNAEVIEEILEASYSTKAARAGKDIGKKGKVFGKIAREAGERYGSEERGKKVAGAILAKLRAKKG